MLHKRLLHFVPDIRQGLQIQKMAGHPACLVLLLNFLFHMTLEKKLCQCDGPENFSSFDIELRSFWLWTPDSLDVF